MPARNRKLPGFRSEATIVDDNSIKLEYGWIAQLVEAYGIARLTSLVIN